LLVKVNWLRRILFVKVIELNASDQTCALARLSGPHQLFLVGLGRLTSYFARIEMSGAPAWEKEIDRRGVDLLLTPIATDDGGIVLVGT